MKNQINVTNAILATSATAIAASVSYIAYKTKKTHGIIKKIHDIIDVETMSMNGHLENVSDKCTEVLSGIEDISSLIDDFSTLVDTKIKDNTQKELSEKIYFKSDDKVLCPNKTCGINTVSEFVEKFKVKYLAGTSTELQREIAAKVLYGSELNKLVKERIGDFIRKNEDDIIQRLKLDTDGDAVKWHLEWYWKIKDLKVIITLNEQAKLIYDYASDSFDEYKEPNYKEAIKKFKRNENDFNEKESM